MTKHDKQHEKMFDGDIGRRKITPIKFVSIYSKVKNESNNSKAGQLLFTLCSVHNSETAYYENVG